MKLRLTLTSLALFAMGIPAWAQPDSTAVTPPGNSPLNISWMVLRAVFSLLIILGLIVGIVLLLKKFGGGKIPGSSNSEWIQILARAPLGPKQYLTLVKIFDRVVLLGVSEGSIQALTEFPPESEVQQLINRKTQSPEKLAGNEFWNLLKNKIKS